MSRVLIRNIGQYVSLTPAEEEMILAAFEPRKLKKKQFLVQAGEDCRFLNFVTAGCFRSYYTTPEGSEYIVQFAVEGWWINDNESFLQGVPALFDIEALEASEVLRISREKLGELYTAVPALERFFRIIYQRSFISLQKRVIAGMSQSAEERYTNFMDKYPEIASRVPQYHLAAYLGMTPEFLSKIRQQLSAGKS